MFPHVSFLFFVSLKPQLNLHLYQVTISLKNAACLPKIFTIASRVCPHKLHPLFLTYLISLNGVSPYFPLIFHFGGMIPSILMKLRINENMVWTDSQDYGADEILLTSQITLFHKTTQFTSEITTLFRVPPQLFHLKNASESSQNFIFSR